MRLLLVIDGMHPRDGGPPVVVAGSALALKALGHDVTILTSVIKGDEKAILVAWQAVIDAGINIELCEPLVVREILPFSADHAVVKAAILDADVVHVHGLWSPLLIHAARISRECSKPYLFSTHGLLDHRAMRSTTIKFVKKRVAVRLLNFRALIRDASAIIFGSEAEALQSWAIVPGMTKVFVPNGVTVKNLNEPVTESEKARLFAIAPKFEEWNRSLLYFARIHPEKGADLLVQAFNIVANEFPEAGLLIAGLRQDEAYQLRVEKLISQTPDPSRLIFTTNLTGAKSQFLYRACDCYILPSHAEGFSVALTEAMANGRPSLITRFCHMPIVEDQGAGIIVEPTCNDIVNGLRKLLAMAPEELRQMGQNAQSLYEDNYTWPKVADLLSTVYHNAFENNGRRTS